MTLSVTKTHVGKVFSSHCLSSSCPLQYQADEFAVGLGYGGPLQSGLVKLQLENLSNMNPDPWYSTYHHSHPVLVERLTAIRHKRKHD